MMLYMGLSCFKKLHGVSDEIQACNEASVDLRRVLEELTVV